MKNSNLFLIVIIFLGSIISAYGQKVSFDDLAAGKKGKCTAYVAKDGTIYNIGDTLVLGLATGTNQYIFIEEYYDDPVKILVKKGSPASNSGNRSIIKKFSIEGGKKSGRYLLVLGSGVNFLTDYYIKLEQALDAGEIRRPGMMTSDEALAELKKAKDKLDLGLITKKEYEALKAKLSKYIK